MVLPIDILRCPSLSISGPNDTPMVDFSATQKKILLFTGGTVTTTGPCISSDRMILVLVLFVAVAVSAIAQTCSRMMLLISLRQENSRRKLSPLFSHGNIEIILVLFYLVCNLFCNMHLPFSYTVSFVDDKADKIPPVQISC